GDTLGALRLCARSVPRIALWRAHVRSRRTGRCGSHARGGGTPRPPRRTPSARVRGLLVPLEVCVCVPVAMAIWSGPEDVRAVLVVLPLHLEYLRARLPASHRRPAQQLDEPGLEVWGGRIDQEARSHLLLMD